MPDVGDGDGAGDGRDPTEQPTRTHRATADAAADAEGLGVGPGTVAVARLTGVIATATANTMAPTSAAMPPAMYVARGARIPARNAPAIVGGRTNSWNSEVGDAVGAQRLRQQEERPGADRRERGNPDGARVGQRSEGGQVGDVRAEVERPGGGAERGREARAAAPGAEAGRLARLGFERGLAGWMPVADFAVAAGRRLRPGRRPAPRTASRDTDAARRRDRSSWRGPRCLLLQRRAHERRRSVKCGAHPSGNGPTRDPVDESRCSPRIRGR